MNKRELMKAINKIIEPIGYIEELSNSNSMFYTFFNRDHEPTHISSLDLERLAALFIALTVTKQGL